MQSRSQFELELLQAADQAQATQAPDPNARRNAARATELYRQLFGLMFDEFFAYKGGFLARDALVEWMRWRTFAYRDAAGAQFAIGPVSYKDAWDQHATSPVVQSEFINFLGEIHRIDPAQGDLEAKIRRVVWRYTPRGILKRFLSWLWRCVLILAALSVLYAAIEWGWPAISGLIRPA